MRTLIVGVGAIGGVVATRLLAARVPVALAARDEGAAARLRASGLRVTGVGGEAFVAEPDVRPLEAWPDGGFDLLVLATKADDAFAVAPRCARKLSDAGVLLPVQNGAVSKVLREHFPAIEVLGGISNLGATLLRPGVFEQRNVGNLVVGAMRPGTSELAERVAAFLRQAVDVATAANMPGIIWSKLLLNSSGSTIGAIAGGTMRAYATRPEGRAVFDRVYDEGLAVMRASGVEPVRMFVEPIPPVDGRDAWFARIVETYGDLLPSMFQDFERGRPTEIDYINGYIVRRGRDEGIPTPVNAAAVALVKAITRGELRPGPEHLRTLLAA